MNCYRGSVIPDVAAALSCDLRRWRRRRWTP